MRRTLNLLLLAALAAASVGCGLSPPRWFNPGTEKQQQTRATLHDPYADVDGGPAVVGGRPRDYQHPRAEPVRAREVRDRWWWF